MRLIGFLVFLITICATSVSIADDNSGANSNVHTISIISAIGDQVTLHKRGITVFDATKATFHLNWDLDVQISDYLSRVLGRQFAIKPNTADAETVRRAFVAKGLALSELGNYLKVLPSAANIDAFVVLVPTKTEEEANPSAYSKTFFGLGVYRDTGLFHASDYVMMYADFDLLVVDAKSGQTIAWAPSRTWGGAPYREGPVMSSCPANIWAQPSDLTEDQKGVIRDEMKILVLTALPRMLTIAGLPSDNSIESQIPNTPDACGAAY